MDKEFRCANAIVWEKDKIIAVGDKKSLSREYKFDNEIDGNGATLLPGFIDPHIHFFDGAMFKGSMDCSTENAPDISSLKKLISEVSGKCNSDEWIVGKGYNPLELVEKRPPDRHDLDEACPDKPVVIFHFGFHECVVNSKALNILGINRKTPNPFAGEIVKNLLGSPTGRLIETAEGEVLSIVREYFAGKSEEEVEKRIEEAQSLLFSYGVTRVADPAVSTSTRKFYEKIRENGYLKLPVVLYPCDDKNMFSIPMNMAEKIPYKGNDPLLTTGPLKFFLDGGDRAAMKISIFQALNSLWWTLKQTFRKKSLEPIKLIFSSPSTFKKDFMLHLGVLMTPTDECSTCVKKAIQNDHSVAFHAIGNEAVEQATDIIKSIDVHHKKSPPPRIEHAVFITDSSIKKIKEQEMAVVTQPSFLEYIGCENIPPLPGFRKIPLRSLLDAGITVSGSSDWPCASCNPLEAVDKAVTRIINSSETVQKSEAVSIKEAISMYTSTAAFVLGQIKDVGTLEPGKRADFILLSKDPFKTEESDLSKIYVKKTYLGGSLVYSCL